MTKVIRHRPEPKQPAAQSEPESGATLEPLPVAGEAAGAGFVTQDAYSGISHSKRDGGIWVARLQTDGRRREVGSSKVPEIAALKWNRALIEAVGGVAGVKYPRRLNEPPCVQPGAANWERAERCATCWAACNCCCVC